MHFVLQTGSLPLCQPSGLAEKKSHAWFHTWKIYVIGQQCLYAGFTILNRQGEKQISLGLGLEMLSLSFPFCFYFAWKCICTCFSTHIITPFLICIICLLVFRINTAVMLGFFTAAFFFTGVLFSLPHDDIAFYCSLTSFRIARTVCQCIPAFVFFQLFPNLGGWGGCGRYASGHLITECVELNYWVAS